jgi:hypothetical protein
LEKIIAARLTAASPLRFLENSHLVEAHMRGKIAVLLGLSLALAAPSAQAQRAGHQARILREHLRDMRDDMRDRSNVWSHQMRAELQASSRLVREQALASARIARGTARAAMLAHRGELRHTVRIHVPRIRPMRVHRQRLI